MALAGAVVVGESRGLWHLPAGQANPGVYLLIVLGIAALAATLLFGLWPTPILHPPLYYALVLVLAVLLGALLRRHPARLEFPPGVVARPGATGEDRALGRRPRTPPAARHPGSSPGAVVPGGIEGAAGGLVGEVHDAFRHRPAEVKMRAMAAPTGAVGWYDPPPGGLAMRSDSAPGDVGAQGALDAPGSRAPGVKRPRRRETRSSPRTTCAGWCGCWD